MEEEEGEGEEEEGDGPLIPQNHASPLRLLRRIPPPRRQ